MNLSNETYERIERYLLQEMTPEEAQNFEADCQANPELAAALAQEKKIHLLIRIHNQSRVRKQIRTLDQSAARPRVSTRMIPFARMRRVTLLIGTIAAIFLVAIGFWWNGIEGEMKDGPGIAKGFGAIWDAPRSSDLFTISYYENLPDSLKDDLVNRLKAAQVYYNQANNQDSHKEESFQKAYTLARMAMGSDSSNANSFSRCEAKLIVVLCALQLNRHEEAQNLIGITKGNIGWKDTWRNGWKTGWKDLQDKILDSSWRGTWRCLQEEEFEGLATMNKQIEKILH